MRILVVVPHYRPDGGPGAPLFTNLCEHLAERGHQVTVLTAVPHYPSGQVPDKFRGTLQNRTSENGVLIYRVALPSVNRRKLFWRLIQFLTFQLGASFSGWRQKYDVLLTVTSALEVWLPFALFSVYRHKPVVYSVHDLYPDVGISLGLFRHKPVIKFVSWLEDYCLNHAANIRVLSESFIPSLVARGVSESKISLVYDWIDTDFIRALPRDNNFARKHNLVDCFVALYAGNMGFIQGLDYVLQTAKLLENIGNIRFVFVGDGAARDSLLDRASELDLRNVEFLPIQPLERMPEVLGSADVSLVPLIRGSGTGALPSKSFSILASERPLIASVDMDSDLVNLVERAQAGICVPPESPKALADAVVKLRNNPALRQQLGKNGRSYVLKNHSPESAAARFEEMLHVSLESSKNGA